MAKKQQDGTGSEGPFPTGGVRDLPIEPVRITPRPSGPRVPGGTPPNIPGPFNPPRVINL